MKSITDSYEDIISMRPNRKARGFINIDCPCCSDRKKRGGFHRTDTGGFRYFCFNGGCDYNDKACGYEPNGGLSYRTRMLYEMLGGSLSDLPLSELLSKKKVVKEDDVYVNKFSEISLPNTEPLSSSNAPKVYDYIMRRSKFLLPKVVWSSRMPEYAILPYKHFGKTVGYLARNIYETTGPKRFKQRSGTNYMYNQDKMFTEVQRYTYVFESPYDAALVGGIGVRSNRMTKLQINLLRKNAKEVVLVPDRNTKEAKFFIDTARANGWNVSVPNWKYKDFGEASSDLGLYIAGRMIRENMNKKYDLALTKIKF